MVSFVDEWLSIIQFFQCFFHGVSNAVRRHDFGGDIGKSDVVRLVVEGLRKNILSQSISFSYASFEQVAFDCPLEEAFWDGDHDFGLRITRRSIAYAQGVGHKALSLRKESLNGDFALESLSFMKRALWHCIFCKKNLESRALESVLSRRLLLEMSR